MTGMVAPSLTAPVWVDTQAALSRMVTDLSKYSQLGVDTESNSLHAYKERVCLIQFSTPQTDYLLDPFPFHDLSPLAPFFANPAIEKIFHASEYDIICLRRDYGFEFHNIFDTMLSARILGKTEIGLGALLEAEFGVTLDKHFQRANWGKRPIEPELMAYARMDTHFLIVLRQRMQAGLTASGLLELAREDFARMAQVVPTAENGSANCWRISGCQHLDPVQMAVLQELWHYRDRRAKQANLPLFKVISNQILLDVASACPANWQELTQIESLTPRLADRHAEGLLQAVAAGLQNPPIPHRNHNSSKPSDAYLKRMDKLRTWRKKTGLLLKVESDVVLPRDMMEKIAMQNPTTNPEMEIVMKELPWRFQHFGDQILEIINNASEG